MNQPQSAIPLSISLWSATLLTRLHRYKELLRQRWWIVVVTGLLGLVYQAWAVLTEPPTYTSVGRMMVKMRIQLPEGGVSVQEDIINFFGTQIELMKSAEVQNRARIRLENPEWNLKNVKPAPVSLGVTRAKDTSLFVLTATGNEPEYTQAFLDTCMAEYINLKKEMRFQTSNTTLAAVTEQIGRLEKEIRQREDDLFDFKRQNNIVSLENRQNAIDSHLKQLTDQLTAMKTEHDLLQSDGAASSTDVAATAAGSELAKARQQLQLVQAKRDELLKTYKPKHPEITGLDAEITQLELTIRVFEKENARQRLTRAETLQTQIQNLEKTVKEEEVKALDVTRPMAEYQKIKSDLTRMQGLHDQLLSSMKSIDLSKNMDQEVVTIMERASKARSARDSLRSRLGLGMLFGIFAGLAILLLLDRVDGRLISLTEVCDQFKERVVGQIPFENVPHGAASDALLLTHNKERHFFIESFRNIRSSLFFMEPDGRKIKTLLLASASPSEGKSTVAANLAITLANDGSRVLLLDADLRRGTIHKLFGIQASTGFSDVLNQRTRWMEAVVEWVSCPGLFILPCGPTISNPGKLFLAPHTDTVLKELQDSFDCVIVDSAPLLAVDDTSSLAPKLDSTIFIIRASRTAARLAHSALELLYSRHVRVLGLVFNGVNTALPDYHYYQYPAYTNSHVENQSA